MGVPLSEFVIESVLRDGLGELRSDPTLLDDIFSRFKQAHFINQFGQTQIDRLKTYVQNNQIRIVQAWAMVPTSVPCFSIQMTRSDEQEQDQSFSNEFDEVDEDITPEILVASVTPSSYNTITGKLVVNNGADLSTICPGLVFVDNSGTKFKIQSGISNLSGNKYINIGSGKDPVLSLAGRIESSIDFERTERKMIRIRETLNIGCHSKDDVHLTKYLYYILMFILKSRQKPLIDRGIHLDRGTGGIYDRDDFYEGENIFTRFMEVNCLTEFDWSQEKVNLVDCFDLTLKTPSPNPDSETTQDISKDE